MTGECGTLALARLSAFEIRRTGRFQSDVGVTGASGRTLSRRQVDRGRLPKEAPALDCFVEPGGLLCGPDCQLRVEDPYALGVLAQGSGRPAGPRVQLHQLPLGRLVQWIECNPLPGVGNARRCFAFPKSVVAACQSFQRRSQFLA